MTETDLHDVLLMRALEREASALPLSDSLAQGLALDLAWAGDQARRELAGPAPKSGQSGPAVAAGSEPLALAWLAGRARLGLARCRQRWGAQALPPGLARPVAGPGAGLAWVVLLAAGVLGLVGDVLGTVARINLLSLPLLGLLAWNLGVYALLAGRIGLAAWPGHRQPGALTSWLDGPLRRATLAWLAQSQRGGAVPVADHDPTRPPVWRVGGLAGSYLQWPRVQAGFAQDWLAATRPLQAARLAALVHAAAACLALGVVASLYARGLVLDYRAGWDSTFLDPAGVRRLLGLLLGPAAAVSGLTLPDAAALAGLRLAGGGSESAARWIHLWAATLGLAVVLPRGVLAALAGWRAHRLARRLALPAGADDLQRLLLSASGAPQPVWVLPYSYQLDAGRQAALATLVARRLGPQVQLQAQPSLPLGAEDALPAGLPEGQPMQVVLLLALTATPERESHGAMVLALQAHLTHLAGHCPLQVWVDESGWRQRLPGAAGAERLQQRRQAWTRLLATLGQVPVFVDLGPADAA